MAHKVFLVMSDKFLEHLLADEGRIHPNASHIATVIDAPGRSFQGLCTCGWSSTFTHYEEADLLRAMHAHAVRTFDSYR